MAVPTCGKCESHGFEIVLFTPIGETYKLQIVQCSTCGTPVGVLDPGPGASVTRLRTQLAEIDERLTRIAVALTS